MCGICGIVYGDRERPVDAPTLDRMTDIMRHRGPDSRGTFRAPGVGLGARRLSIIGLASGDQPISSEDGSLTLVANAEIYNYVELRRALECAGHRFSTDTDIEAVLHLYEDHGPECVSRLRGMFAFALWDAPRRALMLARDRLGIKPLFYAIRPEGLCFASEIKALIASGLVKPEIDPAAVSELFEFGFVRGPLTMCAEARRFQPAHYMLHRSGAASVRRYWQVSFPPRGEEPRIAEAEWARSLRDKLEESVSLHLRSDVPVGAWLSGGLDSSAVTALMLKTLGRRLSAFSLRFEDPAFDELAGAKSLGRYPGYDLDGRSVTCGARDFGLFPRAVWHCENMSVYGIEIPQLLLARATAGSVKAVLTGEGSDEVFGGYRWFRLDKLMRPLAAFPPALRRAIPALPFVRRLWPGASRLCLAPAEMGLDRYKALIGPPAAEPASPLLSDDFASRIRAAVETADGFVAPPPEFAAWYPLAQLQYWELTVRLPDFVCRELDHMSMAASVEARVPFLDHELVELAAAIPPSLKLRRLREKHILRRAVAGVLPPEVAKRRKRGLRAPYQEWLRAPLPECVAEMLSARSLENNGCFRAPAVAQLLRRHKAREGNYGTQLMAVLAVQTWHELFAKGRLEEPAA